MSNPEPSSELQHLKKWRRRFQALYIITSLPLLLIFIALVVLRGELAIQDLANKLAAEKINPPILIALASFATSMIALAGFALTAFLAARKERREMKSFELDNAKKELEIAKLRAELDKGKDDRKIIT